MNLQELEVFIEPDGKVRIEARGFTGGECLQVTAGLEQALGGEILSREMTAEAAGAWQSLSSPNRQTTGS